MTMIDRESHIQFLKAEYRAESETFKAKFLTRAYSLLKESGEMYVGKFVTFRNGEMVLKFPNSRDLPRKGEHLCCMLLPNELQDYRNWGDRTYRDLYAERHKATEAVCIWHSSTDDPKFSLVGFRKIDMDFAKTMENLQGNILVLAPYRPPMEYISNLLRIVDGENADAADILDYDYHEHEWSPILIKDGDVAHFVKTQLGMSDTMILQGPPGTGKTYMIADLCARLCAEGKSVLITALTNRALMEIAEKPFLQDLLKQGQVFKTNMTVDEQKEISSLVPLKAISPMPGCIVLSTYYITSGYAADYAQGQRFDVVIMDEASQALLAMFAALRKIGRTHLWVGDVKQMPPIVQLKDDRVKEFGYRSMIDGLKTIATGSSYPIYQLTATYRFGDRAAKYTGIFYDDTLESKISDAVPQVIPALSGVLPKTGGPTLILTDLALGDYKPPMATAIATYLAKCIVDTFRDKSIAILTLKVETAKFLQRAVAKHLRVHKNLIVETIARVQGLTTDITILVIPNGGYIWSLNPMPFNVATSRAREYTFIIADNGILKYDSLDRQIRRYLSRLAEEHIIYIPSNVTNIQKYLS